MRTRGKQGVQARKEKRPLKRRCGAVQPTKKSVENNKEGAGQPKGILKNWRFPPPVPRGKKKLGDSKGKRSGKKQKKREIQNEKKKTCALPGEKNRWEKKKGWGGPEHSKAQNHTGEHTPGLPHVQARVPENRKET